MYYAHSLDNASENEWQPLSDHAYNVANLAAEFAGELGFLPWGFYAGLLHDAGKVQDAFQDRLRGAGQSVDHSTAGAKLACLRFGWFIGDVIALVVAGHHGGIPNHSFSSVIKNGSKQGRNTLRERLDSLPDTQLSQIEARFKTVLQEMGERSCASAPVIPAMLASQSFRGDKDVRNDNNRFAIFCFVKMLHSCLVDADYLDTERFATPEIAAARGTSIDESDSIERLAEKLDGFMECLIQQGTSSPVNDARCMVRDACLRASAYQPGLFTATAPTGSGKTLAVLSFALHHACENQLKRVIFACPYTSITEQTAAVFKSIFGENNVLEHQSNFDFDQLDEETALAHKLMSQNWSAPIIVTTNVQLFESLFSNKPSKNRKVHNIAQSVVILDEAQVFPDGMLAPTLAMMEEMARAYRTSFVLCSATQPVLDGRWPFGSMPREIVGMHDELSRTFGGRVKFELLTPIDEYDLAQELANTEQALCIVGTKAEARMLYLDAVSAASDSFTSESPQENGFFHLSANMVPAHRLEIIRAIRARLHDGQKCVVVSTQLIEAGVDVDFPVVYREMAGLDSIVQAAGRCNREGRLGCGTVRVFDLLVDGEVQRTECWLESMKTCTRTILRNNGGVVDDTAVASFFDERYCHADLDEQEILGGNGEGAHLLQIDSIKGLKAEQIALDYRIIDEDAVSVFVPWRASGKRLLAELRATEGLCFAARKVQPYCVSISRYRFRQFEENGLVEDVGAVHVLRVEEGCECFYDNDTGLRDPQEGVMQILIN